MSFAFWHCFCLPLGGGDKSAGVNVNRRRDMFKFTLKLASLMAAAALATGAHAAGIISNGTVALGVQDTGALNVRAGTTIHGPTFTSPGVGTVSGTGVRGLFVNAPYGYEATYPGCLCEGWGAGWVNADGTGARSGFDGNGRSNITLVSAVFGTDASGAGVATTIVTIADAAGNPALEVKHDFRPSASAYLYAVQVTLRNLTDFTLGGGPHGLRYTRLMDFDTEPTAFSEFITLQRGAAANLLTTSNDGFEEADPFYPTSALGPCPLNASFVDCGPDDHGARFDFGFDALAAGASRSFTIFYGAAPTEALADAARLAVNAGVFAYGQCDPAGDARCSPVTGAPITYIFGFEGAGVGAPPVTPTPVPEPATLALFGAAMIGLLWTRRRAATRG
jgi:type IV pilus assembly protein PilY1